jgi:hypothetical protein
MRKMYAAVLILLLTGSVINSQTFLRKVLFEEATNASCVPCANNNPFLKAYIEAKGDSIIAIKYHASFPGFDPMYQHNTTQNQERYATYYGMNAMPWLNVDGLINDVWPFTLANFDNAFYGRIGIQSPIQVTVTDQRVAADSIKTNITVYKPTGLPSGNYKLRVMAIEKKIIYSSAPGSNGETVFEHVFRRAYPNTAGTTVNTTAGTENFSFTYHIHADWKDTSVYTVAFVQNDNNKEVLNVGKGSTTVTGVSNINSEVPSAFSLSQNYPNPFNPTTNINFSIPKSAFVTLRVYDMLGREVSSLVNTQMQAGNYTADWNAMDASSGIYFYTITAGDFKETKKMMLIK